MSQQKRRTFIPNPATGVAATNPQAPGAQPQPVTPLPQSDASPGSQVSPAMGPFVPHTQPMPVAHTTPPTGQTQQQPPTVLSSQPQLLPSPSTSTAASINWEEAQCPKELLRASLNAVPQTQALMNKIPVPFGAVIYPMNPTMTIPFVDLGSAGVIRCRKCRAYINPFAVFTDGGRRWRCNLCSFEKNDVPNEYFSPLNPTTGMRTDLAERAELRFGAVEFAATSEYMVRPPPPPVYVFVLDVSLYSVNTGQLSVAAETILQSLEKMSPETKLAFITFDSTCHFYNLRAKSSKPQMIVVHPGGDKVLTPVAFDLLVDLKDSKANIVKLLQTLPKMFANSQDVKSCLGPALKSAFHIQKAIGGKMIVLSSVLPSVGIGTIPIRYDPKILGTDAEIKFQKPEGTTAEFYKKFALNCSKQQICVDFYFFARDAQQFIDVSSLDVVSELTGGQSILYSNCNCATSENDRYKFSADLYANITCETAWEAVMRVRVSQGVKVAQHFGNLFIRSTDLLALPTVNSGKAFAVQLQYTEDLNAPSTGAPWPYISLQAALLYTTSTRERRIRVLTTAIPLTNDLGGTVFNSVDSGVAINLLTKMAIQKCLTSKFSDAREAVVNKVVDICAAYRALNPSAAASAQIVLPDSLKILPLYALAVIKSVLFRQVPQVPAHVRSYQLATYRVIPIDLGLVYLYPQLFALHNLAPEHGVTQQTGHVTLPPVLNLSSEKLDRKGIFLLDNGQYFLVWVAKGVDPDILNQIFGISEISQIDFSRVNFEPNPSLPADSYYNKISSIISYLRLGRPLYQRVYVLREGDPSDLLFLSHFVEDRNNNVYSYYEFLVQLQRAVNSKGK